MCTAAEREYSLEMWRLLDPDNKLIPRSSIAQRIVNVDMAATKKTIMHTLGLARAGRGSFPLAVVFDDQIEVWDPLCLACIVNVNQWTMSYRLEDREMYRVRDILRDLHYSVFSREGRHADVARVLNDVLDRHPRKPPSHSSSSFDIVLRPFKRERM